MDNVRAESINLERPEDERHYSHRQTSISIGTGGVSASHYQERDGEGFGIGYSTSFGDSSQSAFGPTVSIQYTSGNNRLDVSYASMNTGRVAEAWSGGVGGIYDRAVSNVESQTVEFYNLVSSPSNIITEFSDQLSNAAEAVTETVSNLVGSLTTSSTTQPQGELEIRDKGKEKLEDDEIEAEEDDEDFGFNDIDEIDDAQYLVILQRSREEYEERAEHERHAFYANDNEEEQDSSSSTSTSREDQNISQHDWEQQLEIADETTKNTHQKNLKKLIEKLEQEIPNISGTCKREFTENLIEEYRTMIARSKSDITLDDLIHGVMARNKDIFSLDFFSSDKPPEQKFRACLDAIGSTLGYADDQISNFNDRYFTELKGNFQAGVSMVTDRIGKGITYVVGEEGVDKAKKFVVKTVKWSEDNLNPGEQKLLSRAAEKLLNFAGKKAIKTAGEIKGKLKVNEDVINKIESKLAKNAVSSIGDSVEHAVFMGARGENAVKLYTKHRSMTENHVRNLISHGTIELSSNIPAEIQVSKLVDLHQKDFLKYQKWNITEGKEWKMKIIGKPQKTGTEGHARAIAQLATEYAKDPNVEFVFLDQGLKKATKAKLKSNIRPDTMIVSRGGKIDLIEVASKTDTVDDLRTRIETGLRSLPESMQGTINVQRPMDIINRGRSNNQ